MGLGEKLRSGTERANDNAVYVLGLVYTIRIVSDNSLLVCFCGSGLWGPAKLPTETGKLGKECVWDTGCGFSMRYAYLMVDTICHTDDSREQLLAPPWNCKIEG